MITWDRYEVRPGWLEVAPHTNPCSCSHETGSKNKLRTVSLISGAGPTLMSSDRFKLALVGNFLDENAKSLRINHWCDEQERSCWELTKTRNTVRNICKSIALVLFRTRRWHSRAAAGLSMISEVAHCNLLKRPGWNDSGVTYLSHSCDNVVLFRTARVWQKRWISLARQNR